MKRIALIIGVVAVVALIAFRLISNRRQIEEAKTVTTQYQTTPTVEVQPVSFQRIDQNISLLGTVEARQEVKIIAQNKGTLQNFRVDLGDRVRKGQQIGFVRDVVQQVGVQSVEQQVSDAKRELDRYERLFRGGAVTQEQYQKIKDQYESAVIQLKQQRQSVGTGAVIAPQSGIIYDKKVENGEYVNVGSELASIINLNDLKLVVNVPEESVYQLKVGSLARITTDVYPGVTFTGTVHYISPKGDQLHNYPVEIYLTNSTKNPLRAGTLANANFQFREGIQGLFIPRRALVGGAQNASVYVVEGNTARLRKIQLGYDNGDLYQVKGGLQQGEQVVINGQLNLTNGARVTVNRSRRAADTTAVAVNP